MKDLVRAVVLFLLLLLPGPSLADTVDATVPNLVSFVVADTSVSTASGTFTTVSFQAANLSAGQALRISVKADTTSFQPPASGRQAVPASLVNWTFRNALNGTGMNGTLSAEIYVPVYQSVVTPANGSIELLWNLGPPGAQVRAGVHSLSLRWKLEAVTP